MAVIKLIVVLVFAFLLAVFSVSNPNPVRINFFGWSTPEISLIVVVLGCVAVGAIMAGVIAGISQISLKKEVKKKEKEKKELQEKVVNLQLKIREFEEKEEKSSPDETKL